MLNLFQLGHGKRTLEMLQEYYDGRISFSPLPEDSTNQEIPKQPMGNVSFCLQATLHQPITLLIYIQLTLILWLILDIRFYIRLIFFFSFSDIISDFVLE